jgi:hypothetical protein
VATFSRGLWVCDKGCNPSLSKMLRAQFHRGADTFLARPTSRCILFDGENIPFDANLVIYIYIYIYIYI